MNLFPFSFGFSTLFSTVLEAVIHEVSALNRNLKAKMAAVVPWVVVDCYSFCVVSVACSQNQLLAVVCLEIRFLLSPYLLRCHRMHANFYMGWQVSPFREEG